MVSAISLGMKSNCLDRLFILLPRMLTEFFLHDTCVNASSKEVNTLPRESPDYRNNLERLNELYPDREMLSIPDVLQVMGWTDRRTVLKYLPLTPLRQISKATLARIMSGG